MLASAWANGRASLLPSSLRYQKPRVADLWATHDPRLASGGFEIGFEPLPDAEPLEELFALLYDPELLTDEDIERAKKNLLIDLRYSAQSIDTLAHDLAWQAAHHGHDRGRADWANAIASVTPDEVRSTAKSLGCPRLIQLGRPIESRWPNPPTKPEAPTVIGQPKAYELSLIHI